MSSDQDSKDNDNTWDQTLSYDTVKFVRVLDRRLGITQQVFIVVILTYVCFYVFYLTRKFVVEEKVQGWVVISVRHPQFDESSLPWDLYERWLNPGESGAVFIPTHILVTRGQTQNDEYCESPRDECEANEDCDIRNDEVQKAECVNGHCMRRQWCPAEDPDSATTEAHYLEFDQVELRFQTYTQFHKFKMYMATSDEAEWVVYPEEQANTYRLRDLVKWTGIEPSAVTENGAVMLVNMKLDSPMSIGPTSSEHINQQLESHNIDTVTGYNFVHNEFYYEEGVRKRDTYRMFGLRIVAFVTGFAEEVSDSGIVLQIASACALMGLTESLTDFVLTRWLAERKHYIQYKVQETEDFNEDDFPEK